MKSVQGDEEVTRKGVRGHEEGTGSRRGYRVTKRVQTFDRVRVDMVSATRHRVQVQRQHREKRNRATAITMPKLHGVRDARRLQGSP